MAESSFNCSVLQGFNFEKDKQVILGHINSLKIDDVEFASDIAVTNPEAISGDKVKVFSVLSSIYWSGGYSDPVQFSGQVSNANQIKLATLVHTKLKDTAVEFEFTVYDYDFKQKQYYKCFHCEGAKLSGLVFKQGGELAMRVANEASSEVPSPKNYAFSLGVMPAEDKDGMQIHLAVSVSDKFVKQYGVLVSA